jgi:AcrR family transcriptional regulator
LPVREQTELELASANGNMRACGHDLPMVALAGAALAERRDRLAGRVLFCFQPGEAGCDGAQKMITGRLFDVTSERPIAAYGRHVFTYRPRRPPGQCRSGKSRRKPLLAGDFRRQRARRRGGPAGRARPAPSERGTPVTLPRRKARRVAAARGDAFRDSARTAELLQASLRHLRATGIERFSLAGLAEALGTSSRMLIYHFGSRDELLGQVMHAMRAEVAAELRDPEPRTIGEAIDHWWAYYTEHLTEMQLFFHLASRRFEEPTSFEEFASTAVQTWKDYFAEAAVTQGYPAKGADTLGRLCVAALRGLIVDLLITDDRDSVHAALAMLRKYVAADEPRIS